jgi:CDP-diacylglycerol--glycerol-3-phosphate 3-phosphatidyltransferase
MAGDGLRREGSARMGKKEVQERARRVLDPLVGFLVRHRVSPLLLTALGFLLSVAAALAVWRDALPVAGLLLLAGGLADTLDGPVARATGSASKFGAFIDSTIDRYSEIAVFVALAWRLRFDVALVGVVVAVVGSLMVSYTRARAEGLGEECRVGLLERPERLVILILALMAGWKATVVAIWVLAVLANLTAVQRIVHVARRTRGVAL